MAEAVPPPEEAASGSGTYGWPRTGDPADGPGSSSSAQAAAAAADAAPAPRLEERPGRGGAEEEEERILGEGQERCSCGSIFMPDSAFCRKCGRPREGGEVPLAGKAPGDVTARRAPLHLSVLLFFGGRWLDVYCGILVVLLLLKGLWFAYPPGWLTAEVAAALLGLAPLQRLAQGLGLLGNRSQSAPALAASLGLAAPLLVLLGYYSSMQVYVLHLDAALGAGSLALVAAQSLAGAVAGLACSRKRRDAVFVVASFALVLLALIGVIVLGFSVKVNLEILEIAGFISLFVVFVSFLVSMVALVHVLDFT